MTVIVSETISTKIILQKGNHSVICQKMKIIFLILVNCELSCFNCKYIHVVSCISYSLLACNTNTGRIKKKNIYNNANNEKENKKKSQLSKIVKIS